jgi:hypothetical protein
MQPVGSVNTPIAIDEAVTSATIASVTRADRDVRNRVGRNVRAVYGLGRLASCRGSPM